VTTLTKNKFVLLMECVVNTQRFHICVSEADRDEVCEKHDNWVAERHSSPPPTKRTVDEYRKQEKEEQTLGRNQIHPLCTQWSTAN
jgi:hypothetical protein